MALIRDEIRTARKHHQCGAWYWFDRSEYGQNDIDADDWPIIESVRADLGRILPGQKYIYQAGKVGGEFYTFKARQDMHDICLKYDLYPEE